MFSVNRWGGYVKICVCLLNNSHVDDKFDADESYEIFIVVVVALKNVTISTYK